ncbi:MAG: YihY/virulence factor BrkB family protein [Bacteroidales bacterium]|nr:YihY/virulence factor BrkB family protein [Bacteroidales bacterium]
MANIGDKLTKWQKFLLKDIWKMETNDFSKSKRHTYSILKIIIIAVKGFIENGCSVRASALTYFSLLSVVPILALAFAIAKGFGLEQLVERFIMNTFATSPDTANYLISFSSSMLEDTKGGVIAGVGIVMLMYSVFKLLSSIEEAFNYMWNIKKNRPLLRKVTDYITIMIFAPIMLIVASSATFFLRSQLHDTFSGYLSPVSEIIMKLLPWILMTIVFTLIYLIMPNTKVQIKSAIISGVVTGLAFQIWQWIFVTFQIGASNYGAIYGSFAALPLFLMWLQTSWIIVLIGCELTYSVQNVNLYTTERSTANISPRLQKRVALLIMTNIIKDFEKGEKPKDAATWSEELKISQKLFLYIAQKLQEVKLLAEIKEDKFESQIFIPAMDINKISISTICEKLEALGEDEDFPIQIGKDFKKIDDLCHDNEIQNNEKLSKMLLKDF